MSAEPRMWAHSYVRCQRCGYDSLEANEVHVYEADAEVLECPVCRSYDCSPIDVDEARGLEPEEGPDTFECPAPDGLTVMNALVVFDCADDEGGSVIIVQADEGMRKVQTLGLLSFGITMVENEMIDEFGRGEG